MSSHGLNGPTHASLAHRFGSSSYGPPILLWTDLEATGLDPVLDEPIEITAVLTNNQLEEFDRFHAVIRPSAQAMERLLADPFVVAMHTNSGLLAELDGPDTISVADAEQAIIAMLDLHQIPADGRPVSVCGSGVANFDTPMVRHHLPKLAQWLTYFPAVDTGVLRRSYAMWNGQELVEANSSKTHRSTDDIGCHLIEGRAFRHLMTAGHNLAAATMWRTALAHDPEALDGINPVLTALNALAAASGNDTPLTPDLDLDVDGIPMLNGLLQLTLQLLTEQADRTGQSLAEVLNEIRNHTIDAQIGG